MLGRQADRERGDAHRGVAAGRLSATEGGAMHASGSRAMVGRVVAAALVSATLGAGALGVVPSGAASSTPTLVSSTSPVPSTLQCKAGTATGSPGVTSTSISVGAISTLSGPIAATFNSFVPGVKAYFTMINASGGVNGRKIKLAYNLDDTGTGGRFVTLSHTVIDQDHAFAVFASSYFFNPSYFVSTCTPTYGYNTSGDWTNAPSLYAAGGSTQTYTTIVPAIAYIVKKTKSTSFGALSYNVSSSSAACQTTINKLKANGYHVSYTDLKLTPINPNVTPDVQRMKSAGTNFILSCMTVNGNVALARTEKNYGLKVHQLWLTQASQTIVNKYTSLLQGVYFNNPAVPQYAAKRWPATYPGTVGFTKAMNKYQKSFAKDPLALQGWESASLLVTGIKAAGKNLTQAAVVAATNKLTQFTAGGVVSPTNWTQTHRLPAHTPYCSTVTAIKGTTFVPQFVQGKKVYLCFNKTVRNPTMVAPKSGTPGT